MKKLIFSIAALAAIVVMGSCSQDSDLTSTTSSSSKVDSVTVSLNLNSGIEVSESGSSMAQSTVNSANTSLTRAAGTRADATTGSTTNSSSASTNNPTTDFAPTYPSSYTVYFVANGDQGDYTDKEIVYTMNITADNTNLSTVTTSGSTTEVYSATGIKIPAIKYKVYVTNYTTTQTAGNQFNAETLPTSSTTLYLNNGSGTDADLTSKSTLENRTVDVTLTNNYAAVAVAHNDFVSGVKYNVGEDNTKTNYISSSSDKKGVGSWFYLYIEVTDNNITTNSTISLQKILNAGKSVTLKRSITAGNIYQYIINDNYTGGKDIDRDGVIDDNTTTGDGLTISVTPFTKQADTDVSVY